MSVAQPDQSVPEPARSKSSHSSGVGGECTEVAARPGAVHVPDPKDTVLPALTLAAESGAACVPFATRQGQ